MRFLLSLTLLLIFIIFYNNEVKSELSIDTDIKILKAQSEEGNPDAKFYLGSLYYIGRDLKQDYLKAIAVLADKVSRYHERLLAMERDFERHMKDASNHCPDNCDCKKS